MPPLQVIVASPEEALDFNAEFWLGGELMAVTVLYERFDALVDTVESTGADLYAHVRIDGELAGPDCVDAVATEAAGTAPSRARDGARRIVARLDRTTGARPGARMTLGAESARIYLFDAASGSALAGAVATLAAA